MKRTYTAVVERAEPIKGTHESEPYEAGWADEALIFVKVRDGLDPEAQLMLRAQVSPDGIEWVDHHEASSSTVQRDGLAVLPIRNFGNWLRVVTACTDPSREVRASIYLVLKG